MSEFECLDEEVKELLQNYKHKKATVYEPCTQNNIKECLIGLSEELGLYNLNYTFNPYIDVENGTLEPKALIKLINVIWMLLHFYKNAMEKNTQLKEQMHILENNNKQLTGSNGRLKNKLNVEMNESRACVATAQRVSDRSDELVQSLLETKSKLQRLTKQKEASEKTFRNEITKLKKENEKLMDRIRNKSSTPTSCSEVCHSSLLHLKERERKQQAVIAQLQANNQELLQEVLTLKEEILLGGFESLEIENINKK
ncbi:uncharacterized protein LOC131844456 [Achroia grisella]|uniref:uncharacterized protein LOC131844456 n=1 Tax=Achroia grisella TaxID=688607 RepID=UPI0027D2ADF7|nr:uncharacterized protein LOC131844456 [Achroia grisella]XP_059049336.1 uncharacterized protein LOC131844456 [Achroia grisella]